MKLDSNASLLITRLPTPSVCCCWLFCTRAVKLLAMPYTPKPSTACNLMIDTCIWQAEIRSLKFLRHLNSYFTGEWTTELLHKHGNWNLKIKLLAHSNRGNNLNSWIHNFKPIPGLFWHQTQTCRWHQSLQESSISSMPIPSAFFSPFTASSSYHHNPPVLWHQSSSQTHLNWFTEHQI